ncbi:unnamed protein product [Didymodactylos carnosus]|uniref:Transposase n=1 Tax=Didymodactylos carnosus TaxID=1234261 RepID=A0A8S2DM20_9BILA|nr:unnamed protein product [Didymodactylos carnosus]CAF3774692.1 unnamed protein product [Didymodactylos carnosus]
MSIIDTISQRLLWAFADETKRSFKAAAIIVNVGRLVPASYVYPLPPPGTSEESINVITTDNLASSLQFVWSYYELINFLMMTSKSIDISYPCAMVEGRTKIKGKQSSRAVFIERNLNWIYHMFTVFWSNHEDVFGSCKCGSCSRVVILDGHQKPRRVNHEGPRKITDHLLTILKLGAKLPFLLVYDAACQLHKFWQFRFSTEHMQKTKYTQQLMEMKLVTDRFHNTVHKKKLCKTLFNPDSEQNKADFIAINTSIAEQTFSYLTNFKLALRSFAYPTSALFTILLLHLKNCDKLNQDPAQQGLIIGSTLESKIQDQASYRSYCVFETLLIEEEHNEDDPQPDEAYVDMSDHDDNNDR